MSKTIVEREFWNDEQVIDEYSPEDKLFMMYLLTCPRGNSIGIYKIPIKIMAFEIGYSPEAIRVLIDRFMNKYDRITYDYEEQEIAIHNTLKYTINRGGKPIEEMVARELQEVKNLMLIEKVYHHMLDWWDLSKRDIDNSIKNVFEKEMSKRQSVINNNINNTNTYTNTNTNTYTYTYTKSPHVSYTDSVEDDEIDDIKEENDSCTVSYTDSTISNQEKKEEQRIPKKEIMEEWNKLGEPIKKIQALNPGTSRYKHLKARIKEFGEEKVIETMKSIDSSRFLKGENSYKWVVNFDWFVKPVNFAKILEGRYTNEAMGLVNNSTDEYLASIDERMNNVHN